jgi:hypothetical protein
MRPKILLSTLIGVLGCLFVNATEIDPNEGPGKGVDEMNGNVVDAETKKPLKDVTITAYTASKKEKYVLTDDQGKYGFEDLKPGIYKIVFEREGYKKVTREKIVIRTDETFQMNIEMIENPDFNLMPSPFHLMDN